MICKMNIYKLIPIEPVYEIFDDIKKIDDISVYTIFARKYMDKLEKTYIVKEKKKILYNLIYFAYLNIDMFTDNNKYIKSIIEKIFELMKQNMNELICFILYFTSYNMLTPEQQIEYKVELKKYEENNTPKDNGFEFKDYEIFEYLSYDIEKFLQEIDYFPTNERIKEIFQLFVKYEKIIKKDKKLKEVFEKTYHKTQNNLVRYCYNSV